MFGSSILLIVLSRAVAGSPLKPRDVSQPGLFDSIISSTTLVWTPCQTIFQCAVLDVPLDYANPAGTRSFLPLIKFPASTTPYKGMVFINPGGPGSSAIDFLLSTASFLSTTVGTNYDLVAYEPRGIGYSQPSANCSTTVPVQQLRKRLFNLPYGPRLPSKFYEDEYVYQQVLGSSCAGAIGGANQVGQHMSTAIVVKDAISVLDAFALSSYSNGLSNPKDFNFWGFSYGTVIGQTFAMMYPNRVGRFVLDGVVDAEDYYAGLGLKNVYLADRAFSTFFAYCNKAGPNACSYYTGSTSKDIYERFQRTVLKLDAKKAYQENWSNKTAILLGLQGLKLIANIATVDPINYFPFLPQVFEFFEYATQVGISIPLVGAFESQIADALGAPGFKLNLHPPGSDPQWPVAVGCPDTGNRDLGKSLQELQPVTSFLENQSWLSGELYASIRIACTQWSIPGKGRYTGGFGGSTKTPILFVSNTRDPRTPIPNGVKASIIFNKAKLLSVDGTGHLSFTTNNRCAARKIGEYFQTGVASSSFCPLEAGPFGVIISGIILKRNTEEIEPRITELLNKLSW